MSLKSPTAQTVRVGDESSDEKVSLKSPTAQTVKVGDETSDEKVSLKSPTAQTVKVGDKTSVEKVSLKSPTTQTVKVGDKTSDEKVSLKSPTLQTVNVGDETSDEKKENFCCEAVFELVVDDCTNKLRSEAFSESSPVKLINNFFWQLKVEKKKNHGRILIAKMVCLPIDEKIQPNCYFEYYVRLINHLNVENSVTQPLIYTSFDYNSSQLELLSLINISQLSNGFIKDDRFILEAHVAFGHCKPRLDICKTKEDALQKDLSLMEVDIASIQEQAGQDGTCEFLVGEETKTTKRASKVLLALKSPVFDRMFFGPLQEEGVIEVTDIEPDIFDIMLRHIYEAEWKFESKEQVYEVFYAAQKYMLSLLMRSCIEHVWPNKIDDVVFTLNFSKNFNLKYLEEEVMKIVRKNIKEVLKHPDFVDLTQDSLLAIVEQSTLNLDSELELFNAVVLWSRAQCKRQGLEVNGHNIRAELLDVLKHIRFLAMSPKEVIGPVCDADIFTTEEQNVILRQYISKETAKSLSNVCCLKSPREKY